MRKHLDDDSRRRVDELAPQRGGPLAEAALDPGSLLLVRVGGRALPIREAVAKHAVNDDRQLTSGGRDRLGFAARGQATVKRARGATVRHDVKCFSVAHRRISTPISETKRA